MARKFTLCEYIRPEVSALCYGLTVTGYNKINITIPIGLQF